MDYSAVDAALARVPDNLSIYTDESVDILRAAINAVEPKLTKEQQSIVDGWAIAINSGIDGLVLKEKEYKDLPFTDVTEGDWFYDTIYVLYNEGIVKGITETTYGPNFNTTRCQMAALLYRISGSPSHNGMNPFTDVYEDEYYYDAVCWGYEIGVLKGVSETKYDPNTPITREQFAAMLYRLYGEPEFVGDLNRFDDAHEASDYAIDALAWCTKVGIITGITPSTLDPRDDATRAQVATMLLRYMNLPQ